MSKPELGIKRDCPECGARFYDLTKEPAHCPKCEHEFIPEALLKPRKNPKVETAEKKPPDPAKPDQETSLESADNEQKAATSKKRASLDDGESESEGDGAAESSDDELAAVGDIDIDIDDDDDDDDNNNNSLLVKDDDDDVTDIVKPTSSED